MDNPVVTLSWNSGGGRGGRVTAAVVVVIVVVGGAIACTGHGGERVDVVSRVLVEHCCS